MGLDMWMLEVKKMTKKEIDVISKMSFDEFNELPDYSYWSEEDIKEENEHFIEDLKPYTVTLPFEVKEIDYEKIKSDYNVAENARLWHLANRGDKKVYGFQTEDDKWEVQLTKAEVEGYLVPVTRNYCIYKRKEVAYWRKFYELQDKIYDMYYEETGKSIQNCGMHELSNDMINMIAKTCKAFDYEFKKPKRTKTNAFFYHEWY